MSIRYYGQLIQGDEPTPPKPSRLYDVGTRVLFITDRTNPPTKLQLRFS